MLFAPAARFVYCNMVLKYRDGTLLSFLALCITYFELSSLLFQRPFHLEKEKWWEIVLNISSLRKTYNPFSGKNEVWAAMGNNGLVNFVSKNGSFSIG